MQGRMLHTQIASAILLIALVLATHASGQNSRNRDGHHADDTWVRISVFTDHPLADADVVISRTDGVPIFEREHATNERGFYPALVGRLPRNFRVTVVWEANRESRAAAFRSLGEVRLSADVRNFDRVHGVVYVNPVTTMVSRLLDRRPQLGLLRAQILVRLFLGLPVNASLGAALREGKYFQSSYFSQSKFMAAANHYGSFDGYLEKLLSEAIYNRQLRHPFRPPGNSGQLGGIASFLAENLAKGALSWAAGQGAGWVAQSAGLTTPGATADDIAQLQESLDNLQSSVDQLSKQLDAATQEILAALLQTQYSLLASPALALGAQVNGVESDLTYFVEGCPPLPESAATERAGAVPADYCKTQKALVINELANPSINHSYETFSNAYLLDTQAVSFKGMLHLFSLSTGQSLRFFRPADSTTVINMFNYWDAVETQAANLKVELLHLQGAEENPAGVKELTDFLGDATANPPTQGLLQKTHGAELQLIWFPVPVGTVINTKDKTMWLTNYPVNFGCNAAPPSGGAWTSAQSQFVNIQAVGWLSPTVDQAKALIDGWTGASPNQWLVDQTTTGPNESPQSLSFAYVITHCGTPRIWTRDATGSSAQINGQSYATDFTLNLQDGTFPSPTSSAGARGVTTNWIFLVRTLMSGEQYYWYQ